MPGRGPLPLSRELALALASGFILVLAFPPTDLVPAAFVALVPLFFVLTRPRGGRFWSAFRPGFVAGLAFFTPLLCWLVFLSSDQMDNPVVMSGPLVLLVLLQSTFWERIRVTGVWICRTVFGSIITAREGKNPRWF